MSQYNKFKEFSEDLSALAKKYNIVFVTATQPPRKDSEFINLPIRTVPDIIVIDHINLIK